MYKAPLLIDLPWIVESLLLTATSKPSSTCFLLCDFFLCFLEPGKFMHIYLKALDFQLQTPNGTPIQFSAYFYHFSFYGDSIFGVIGSSEASVIFWPHLGLKRHHSVMNYEHSM